MGVGTCLAGLAVLLDEPAPPLVPAKLPGDGPADRQAAVIVTIGDRPQPGLALQIGPGGPPHGCGRRMPDCPASSRHRFRRLRRRH